MRNCQLSHFQTSDPQKLWVAINVDCSFKSLNFGIICYIAIADKHSRFTKDHVTWVLYWKPSRKEVKFVQHGFSFLINTFWVLISPLLLRSVFWYILELSWNQNQADGSIIGKIYIFFSFLRSGSPSPTSETLLSNMFQQRQHCLHFPPGPKRTLRTRNSYFWKPAMCSFIISIPIFFLDDSQGPLTNLCRILLVLNEVA